jgi:hypothetical protein
MIEVKDKDFVKLVEMAQGFIEFAPSSNYDNEDVKFVERMEDKAIGDGAYHRAYMNTGDDR